MDDEAKAYFRKDERFRGYIVEKPLGAGGVGAVYLVRHEVLKTHYALKVLDPELVRTDPMFVSRFLREARLAARIRHPNLVTVHDCGHDGEKNLYYLIMDYVPGCSLRDRLAFGDPLPCEQAIDVVAQLSAALDAAQAFQVVHRDIKPENIMIQPDGRVKLVDLGIAKAQNLGDSLQTKTGRMFGTLAYISPEQARCSADVDTRADIYSLGVVFFEMLTKTNPYANGTPVEVMAKIMSDDELPDVRDIVSGLDPAVAILIRRMTVKDRARRLASFADVLRELAKLGVPVCPAASEPSKGELAPQPEVGMKTFLDGLNSDSHTGPVTAPRKGMKMPFLVVACVLTAAALILLVMMYISSAANRT